MSPQTIHAFAEKVALVTDGTSRIGRAVALQLALQGAYVCVGYSDVSAGVESAVDELRSLGTLAGAFPADVSTPDGAKFLVSRVQELYGRLDLLVNCAGFRPESTYENITGEMFTRVFNTNTGAAFFVTQAAVPLMKERPKPKIVNIVSACDTIETMQNVPFALTQAAVAEFTRSLAATLPKNFRVNCVKVSEKESEIGPPDNDLFRADKGVSATHVASVTVYLLSGEAIGLNGQILTVE
jgi:3-oxoacyl-[acyl-carrier protein] reductase